MAEGWKQLLEDLRRALGLGDQDIPSSSIEPEIPRTAATVREAVDFEAPLEGSSPEEPEPAAFEPGEGEAEPRSAGQRFISFAGLAVTLVLALGVGWYVYFGGPRPPAPDVVATFDGGKITVQQVRQHLALLIPAGAVLPPPTYEDYRSVVQHMLLNELVRRWAAEQKMDASARFKDAMRHVSESVTLDEWVGKLHQDEMLSSVTESDIQAFYESNAAQFANTTLAEAREQIRQMLAHQNQQKFFQDYLARLRSEATIVKEYELLQAPAPSDEQVQRFYEDNPDQFRLPKRALVDRIFIASDDANPDTAAQADARAQEARAALQAGKNFSEVAGKYSQEPYSPQGVTIEEGKDDTQLEKQAFALSQAGDLSPVIRAEKGYYVLLLREQQPARRLTLEEAYTQATAAVAAKNEGAWFEQNSDRTLFTIHGERFTLGQFYHEYQNLSPELKNQFAGPDGMIRLADALIDRMLVLDDAYNKLVDQENAPLLEEARTTILRQMVHEAEVSRQVTVSDEDIRNYYESQKDHFVTPPEARIRSIRISLGQSEEEQQRARAKANEAYRKLVPGLIGTPADFDQVAKEYDESEKSPAGGELEEWIRMGNDPVQNLIAHPLHQYVLPLPVGAVSQPFEFGQDIYIVKVLERVESKPLAFEQIKDELRAELEARKHAELDAEVASRLLQDARATIYDQVIQSMVNTVQATSTP